MRRQLSNRQLDERFKALPALRKKLDRLEKLRYSITRQIDNLCYEINQLERVSVSYEGVAIRVVRQNWSDAKSIRASSLRTSSRVAWMDKPISKNKYEVWTRNSPLSLETKRIASGLPAKTAQKVVYHWVATGQLLPGVKPNKKA